MSLWHHGGRIRSDGLYPDSTIAPNGTLWMIMQEAIIHCSLPLSIERVIEK
ncbi:hypothetical protein [Microbacter margulisiae]|uniref:hypothetical protein n=1 Tax=Microbacter margulisiae TaxID=1350067 RepID=UPI001611473D|nr:hypothetical protein [Microbacter margulisiae]